MVHHFPLLGHDSSQRQLQVERHKNVLRGMKIELWQVEYKCLLTLESHHRTG